MRWSQGSLGSCNIVPHGLQTFPPQPPLFHKPWYISDLWSGLTPATNPPRHLRMPVLAAKAGVSSLRQKSGKLLKGNILWYDVVESRTQVWTCQVFMCLDKPLQPWIVHIDSLTGDNGRHQLRRVDRRHNCMGRLRSSRSWLDWRIIHGESRTGENGGHQLRRTDRGRNCMGRLSYWLEWRFVWARRRKTCVRCDANGFWETVNIDRWGGILWDSGGYRSWSPVAVPPHAVRERVLVIGKNARRC